MTAYLRELAAAAALVLFMLGFTTVGALIVESADVDHGITLAEAQR